MLRKKVLEILLLFVIALLAFVFSIMITITRHFSQYAEEFVYGLDVISHDVDLQTIQKMFGKEIKTTCNMLNYDGANDYLYVDFKEGGYAIFAKNTFELLEFTDNDYLPFKNEKEIYYFGPGAYCKKYDNDSFFDLSSKAVYKLSIEERVSLSNQLRNNFMQERNVNGSEAILSIEDSTNNNFRDNSSYTTYDGSIKVSAAYGTYIPNYHYFLFNPYHTDNEGTTCGAVATQLFLGYHNFYNDRSIIDTEYLFGTSSSGMEGDEYNPNNCSDPMTTNNYALGSNDSYYNRIKSYVINPNGSATIASVRSGVSALMPNALTDKSDSYVNGVPYSDITDEIDAGNPVIIGMNVILGGVNHAVVAYGYHSVTSSGQTYHGYLVHLGQDFSDGTSQSTWINKLWCLNFLWSHNTHTHNYSIYTGGLYNEIKCSTCGHRRYAYTTNILSNTEVEITGNMADFPNTVTNISLPDTINGRTVTKIGNNAFREEDFTSVVLPAYLTEIGNYAFYSCSSMTSITFNNILETIGDYAFFSCTSISNITLPNSLETIGVCAFSLCHFTSIQIPSYVTEIKTDAFTLSSIETIEFMSTSHLEAIGTGAFGLCMNLTRVVVPPSVITIEDDAFAYDPKLEYILLPSTVETMGSNVFKNSSKLTIYTEHNSIPTDWSSTWNSSNRPVFLGCSLNMSKKHVAALIKTATNPCNTNATNGISDPYRSGYTFGGWYTTSDFSGTQYTSETITSAPNGTLYAKWNSESCIAAGSMITLADGTQTAVENLTGNEYLLVWDMLTGQFTSAPILFIDSDPVATYEIIKATFSDGTEVKIIDEHAFFDMTLGEYVFFRKDAAQYIGHYFNKQSYDSDNNMVWTTVQLTNITITTEQTTAWSPVTYGHLCYYVNGMLSMPGATEGFINIFETNTVLMKYDENQMEEDILTYGVYTYEEFNTIIPLPELVFNAFNGQYLKVSIGKGLITLPEIAELLERYAEFFI